MNRFDQQWQKLIALARSAPADSDAAVPFGFATRVAARAATAPAAGPWASFERFALRGLMVAAALSLAAVVFNYTETMSEATDDLALTDTVSEMLDLS